MEKTVKSHIKDNVKKADKKGYSKKTELVTRTNIENSPFEIIGIKEKNEYFATLGEYRITEIFKTKKEAIKEVSEITWNRIIQVQMILIEKLKKEA